MFLPQYMKELPSFCHPLTYLAKYLILVIVLLAFHYKLCTKNIILYFLIVLKYSSALIGFSGYAADDITHCIRPQDIKERRAVIILRKWVLWSWVRVVLERSGGMCGGVHRSDIRSCFIVERGRMPHVWTPFHWAHPSILLRDDTYWKPNAHTARPTQMLHTGTCEVFHTAFTSASINRSIFLRRIKLRWDLFVTYTIIQSISAHTLGAVGSRHCGARGAVGGSVPCSRVSPQSWHFLPELRFEPTSSGYKSDALSIRANTAPYF